MFFFRRRNLNALPLVVQHYVQAPRIETHCHWRDVNYTVLDIETSGLNPRRDSILAIGIIKIHSGRIRLDQRWYTLVHPPDETLVGADSIRIHGLLRSDLANAPPPEDVLPILLDHLTASVLIVHVSSIDVQFLDRALRAHFGIRLRGPALDTARLAGTLLYEESFYSGMGSHEAPRDTTLRTLTKKANLPINSEHNALSDALTTAQLFLTQVVRFEKRGDKTVHTLLRLGGCLR